KIELSVPQIPYISNVTGTWMTAEDAIDPQYWVRHLRHTVRFYDGLHELVKDPDWILLEVGPGQSLTALAKQHPREPLEQLVLPTLPAAQRQESDLAFLLNTAGRLWLAGLRLDWTLLYQHQQRQRLALPTYPFERQCYWIGGNGRPAAAVA